MKITLLKLHKLDACMEGVTMFKNQFGEEAELKDVITWAIDSDNIEAMHNANWLIVRMTKRKQRLAYAVYAAKQVLPIFEEKYPEDKRPRIAIEAAEACIEDDSKSNKRNARSAAYAAYAAAVANYVANATANAVHAAAHAANYAAAPARRAAYATEAAEAAAYAAKKDMMINILRHGLTLILA